MGVFLRSYATRTSPPKWPIFERASGGYRPRSTIAQSVPLCTLERRYGPCVRLLLLLHAQSSKVRVFWRAKPVAISHRPKKRAPEKPASAGAMQSARLSFALTRAVKGWALLLLIAKLKAVAGGGG